MNAIRKRRFMIKRTINKFAFEQVSLNLQVFLPNQLPDILVPTGWNLRLIFNLFLNLCLLVSSIIKVKNFSIEF